MLGTPCLFIAFKGVDVMRNSVQSFCLVMTAMVSTVSVADTARHHVEAGQRAMTLPSQVVAGQNQGDEQSTTFSVTVAEKDNSHPYFGTGDRNGFVVDGVQGKELILVRGTEYRFVVKSTPMHDVYLSGNEDGWGAGVIEAGVKGNFIYDGVLTFTPGESTPEVVYYQCQNHKGMGSRMFVVDPGTSYTLSELHAKHGIPEVLKIEAEEATEDEVKQKLSYATMVAMSKPAKRVRESGDAQAKALVDEAAVLLKQAREESSAGKQGAAMTLVDQALRKLSEASQRVPSAEVNAEQRLRYEGLLRSVSDLRKTHQEKLDWVVKQKGAAKAVRYDVKQVDEWVRQATQAAARTDYRSAVSRLLEAEKSVTMAMNQMLDAQTMVYKLNLDTPEGEYAYERDRYLGYEELVPVALKERQPDAPQRSLFEGYVAKASTMYQEAQKYGERKEYPDAIKLLQEASAQLLRGLRLLGVNQ